MFATGNSCHYGEEILLEIFEVGIMSPSTVPKGTLHDPRPN